MLLPCSQPLLIHDNGTATCFVPGCLKGHTLGEAVRRHPFVANCRGLLGSLCSVCHGSATDPTPGGPAGAIEPTCPGGAIVHADLSVGCSEPDCRPDASQDIWFAKHRDIRSCVDLPSGCPLCAVPDDHEAEVQAMGMRVPRSRDADGPDGRVSQTR